MFFLPASWTAEASTVMEFVNLSSGPNGSREASPSSHVVAGRQSSGESCRFGFVFVLRGAFKKRFPHLVFQNLWSNSRGVVFWFTLGSLRGKTSDCVAAGGETNWKLRRSH
jgi:hypothetical protein